MTDKNVCLTLPAPQIMVMRRCFRLDFQREMLDSGIPLMKSRPLKHTPLFASLTNDDGEVEHQPLSFALIKRLFTFTRPYQALRGRLIFFVLLRSLLLPLNSWAAAAILGGPIEHLNTHGILVASLLFLGLITFTQYTFSYRMRYGLQLGEKVINDVRDKMFHRLQSQPMKFFNEIRVGKLIARFTSDADTVRAGVQDVLFISVIQGGQMIVAAIIMALCDFWLFLILIGMTPILWGLNTYFRRRLSHVHRAVQESFSRVTATLAESVSGIRVTQGFSRERMNAGLFGELVRDHANFNQDVARASGLFIPLLEFNNQFFVAVLLMVGGWRVISHRMDIAELYQFVIMSGLFFSSIINIGQQFNNALSSMAAAERVFKLLDTEPDWTDAPDAAPHALTGRVEFDHLSFHYNAGRPILRDISFVAQPGQTIALVGHTGSGKSTLINLVAKFYLPSDGRLLLDDCDITRIASPSLHRQIAVVFQQNFLFSGTLIDNIRIGRPDATDDEVRLALEKLECTDALESLPQGLYTRVGERGAGISLGQRQLVCFARAMLADPRIMILDEATSSIDAITEIKIQHALSLLLKGRTAFVVAHRLSTIRNADLVLLLQNGAIIERGSHDELIAQNGAYARLYMQFVKATNRGGNAA